MNSGRTEPRWSRITGANPETPHCDCVRQQFLRYGQMGWPRRANLTLDLTVSGDEPGFELFRDMPHCRVFLEPMYARSRYPVITCECDEAAKQLRTDTTVLERCFDVYRRLACSRSGWRRSEDQLTEEGQVFYTRCERISADIAEAEAMATSMGEQVVGTLRVAVTLAFTKARLLPVFPEFLKRNPNLKMEFELTDRSLDVVEEKIDVAIRFTEQFRDTSVVARRLVSNERVIRAPPAYLGTFGVPGFPEDSQRPNCLRLSTVSNWNDWEFEDKNSMRSLQVKGNFEANSVDAIYHAALSGLGIARLSSYLVAGDLPSGRLAGAFRVHPQEGGHTYRISRSKEFLAEGSRVRRFSCRVLRHRAPWERAAGDADIVYTKARA